MTNQPTPFWSSETERWSSLCPVGTDADESFVSKVSWAKLNFTLGSKGSKFPKLNALGNPQFVPTPPDGKKLPAGRTRKIKLKPNPGQKRILNQWFNTARWTYNRCVNAITEQGIERSQKALRAHCLHNSLFITNNCWVTQTPFDVRDAAMQDVLKAYKTNFAAKRKYFKIKYKSRKARSDSITIHAKYWKTAGVFYPKSFGKKPIRACELLPEKLDYDTRLQRTRLGEFYLCLLSPLAKRSESQAPSVSEGRHMIALDPGVRTFQTGYCPDGSTMEFAPGDVGRIARLCIALDKLQSKWSQSDVNHKHRYSIQKAGRRLREKIKNLVRDLHHSTAKLLCRAFETILIPVFETRHMVSKVKRRIGSQTARMMLTWSHFQFRKILKDKAREYPWCSVFVVDESYTSKTCGSCGQLHQSLGAAKTFVCPSCQFALDRDVNGARNILLRFVSQDARVREAGLALGPSPWSSLF